jgi:hypothetical protein
VAAAEIRERLSCWNDDLPRRAKDILSEKSVGDILQLKNAAIFARTIFYRRHFLEVVYVSA